MATNQQSKQPVNTLRCSNIKATIWQNVRGKGLACSSRRPSHASSRIRPVGGETAPRLVSMLVGP